MVREVGKGGEGHGEEKVMCWSGGGRVLAGQTE